MGTPSQDIVAATNVTATVEEGSRTITIRKLGPLDRMKLAEVVGADNVRNDVYFGYASLAYHVTEIDGKPLPRAASKIALEAVVQRLGDAGLVAVADGISKNFIDADRTDEETKDAIKN